MNRQVTKSLKENWSVYLAIAILILLVGGVLGYFLAKASSSSVAPDASSINSFEECAAAGYPIQESYPEVCAVPGGKSFVNN